MHDNDARTSEQSRLAELEQSLWEQKLHDPAVFKALERQRAGLRLMTPSSVLLLVTLAALTLWLSLWWHGAFAVLGVLVGLVGCYRKGRDVTRKTGGLDHLIGPPGIAFPSIAVNKIEAEARDRSSTLKDYIKAVNAGGRYRLTAFEVEHFVQILSAMDRLVGL